MPRGAVVASAFKHLRVEDDAPAPVASAVPPELAPLVEDHDVAHWKKLALSNGERLRYSEEQAQSLRQAADEARARFGKYKQRLDGANARVNELQVALTDKSVEVDKLRADIDHLRAKLARQDAVKRRVHEYRQSLLDGPIWELFAEFCNESAEAGEEKPA